MIHVKVTTTSVHPNQPGQEGGKTRQVAMTGRARNMAKVELQRKNTKLTVKMGRSGKVLVQVERDGKLEHAQLV